MQDPVPQSVAIQAGDGRGRLPVVRHGDKAKALALGGVEVAEDLDTGDGAKGPKQLPQEALVGVHAQVKDADALAQEAVAQDAHAAHVVHAHGEDPGGGREGGSRTEDGALGGGGWERRSTP